MTRHLPLACAGLLAAGLALAASPAHAQVAGTYSGTTQDGNGMTIVVGDDGNGGLAITSLNYGITATCTPGGSVFNTGWGLPEFAEIVNGQASFTSQYTYIDTKASFSFTGDIVSGRVASVTPSFAPTAPNTRPTRSVLCSAPSQNFSLTLVPAAAAAAIAHPRPGTATVYLPPTR